MKKIVLGTFLLLATVYSTAQTLDGTIKTLAQSLAHQAPKSEKIGIAVGDILNNAGTGDVLTKYITEQLEIYLIETQAFQIVDRRHIREILKERNLQSQGIIDESTTRSAIEFLRINGLVLGEVTSFGEKKKITLRISDIETSQIIAATTSGLIDDPAISGLVTSTKRQKGTLDCQVNNTGDYCFENTVDRRIIVRVYKQKSYSSNATYYKEMVIASKNTDCLHGAPPDVYQYKVFAPNTVRGPLGVPIDQGTIRVQQCKVGQKLIQSIDIEQPRFYENRTTPNNTNKSNFFNIDVQQRRVPQRTAPRRTSNPRY